MSGERRATRAADGGAASGGLLGRLSAAFLADATRAAPEEAMRPTIAAAPAIAALCRPEDAWVVGGTVALATGRVAVVAAWGAIAPPVVRAPATPGARRLAAALARRGHAATSTGRLVHVPLGASASEACAEAARVAAAAGDAACVAVLAGPRDERVDALLRAQDRVVVAAEEAVAELAVASVAALGVAAEPFRIADASPATRALAATGVAAPRRPR